MVPGSLGKTIAMLRQGKMLELPQQQKKGKRLRGAATCWREAALLLNVAYAAWGREASAVSSCLGDVPGPNKKG